MKPPVFLVRETGRQEGTARKEAVRAILRQYLRDGRPIGR